MALYIVRARPKNDLLSGLKELNSGEEISRLRPFGKTLHYGLDNVLNLKIENEELQYK